MVLAKIMKSLYFFFLGKIRQKKVIGNVLYRKLAFLDYKNNDLKKAKTFVFAKGVSPWFWPKLICFYICSFWVRQAKKKSFVTFYIEN